MRLELLLFFLVILELSCLLSLLKKIVTNLVTVDTLLAINLLVLLVTLVELIAFSPNCELFSKAQGLGGGTATVVGGAGSGVTGVVVAIVVAFSIFGMIVLGIIAGLIVPLMAITIVTTIVVVHGSSATSSGVVRSSLRENAFWVLEEGFAAFEEVFFEFWIVSLGSDVVFSTVHVVKIVEDAWFVGMVLEDTEHLLAAAGADLGTILEVDD